LKKLNNEKKLIKPIKILKKNWPVLFGSGFISLKPKKPNRTELKPKNRKKLSQTGKTESESEKTEKTG